jgi:beta-lactam-binding protein with PASTA domain
MKKIWDYISAKPILKNIIYMFLLSLALIWITMFILRLYTQHGKTISVPDFSGVSLNKLGEFAESNRLRYIIIDSIYDSKKPRGSVASQEPVPGSKVKEGRTIYLTVIANMPEQVIIPNLIDLSLRQAVSILETYGLKPGRIEFRHSEFKNAVLEQRYKGRATKTDQAVKLGSAIDLVLGDGIKPSETGEHSQNDTITNNPDSIN